MRLRLCIMVLVGMICLCGCNLGVRGMKRDYPAFSDTISFVVGEGGNFPATWSATNIIVLRQSAWSQAPLNDDGFYWTGTDPVSGVVLEATLEFWGHPVGQPSRECVGVMRHQFTVFDAYDFDPDAQAAQCIGEAIDEDRS